MVNDEGQVFEVTWTFSVRSNSQVEANLHVQAMMRDFAEFMKWPKPMDLEKDATFATVTVPTGEIAGAN
jgi:hypothetical protein